jgi:RNA polymerase sigma-70 factor, ECF subfamily
MVQAARLGKVISEWIVLERAQHGDASAWRELTSKHQARLTAIALFVTRSPAAADDVVQETFVRALRAEIKHRDGSVQGFLGTIAYRLALKEVRRGRRHLDLGSLASLESGADSLAGLLSEERDRHVAAAIHALDDDHRDVLVLRFYGGHSYEAIANLLQVPLGTVKSRIFYAVQACRKRLREEGLLE